MLSDVDHKVIDSYGVYDAKGKIAVASVFVVDSRGIVRWSYIGEDYKVRPLNDVLLEELAKIN